MLTSILRFNEFFLLTEGGLGGHMDHLYDHWDLTFGDLKQILTKASTGELEGTEKTDGQNIFITYNIEQRDARAVRNKGNAKAGGLDAAGLAAKFSGTGGQVQAVFIHAFNMFKKGIEALSDDEIIDLFGREGNVFYNAEVIDSRTSNVINYDYNTLLVHRDADYVAVDFRTGELKSGFDPGRSQRLAAALEKMNEQIHGQNYAIMGDAIRRLGRLENDTALRNALIAIRKLGVKDTHRIKDYLVRQVKLQINNTIPHLKPKLVKILIVKIVENEDETKWKKLGFDKSPTITQILKDLDSESKIAVKSFYDNRVEMIKGIIHPLELTIHEFGVEMLKTLESTLIIDNKAELKRQRDEVAAAIRNIEASGHEEALDILKKQLIKLGDAENISSATEGFVFRFGGHTYKFTGNFAPVNQILGLFKYGRGNIKPEDLRMR
jgi:hypothetical protein